MKQKNDINDLFVTISIDYASPITAKRYAKELIQTINSLRHSPDSYNIQTSRFLQQYGYNVRRINYKKMAIIYTVHGNMVYVHRIIPSSMIYA